MSNQEMNEGTAKDRVPRKAVADKETFMRVNMTAVTIICILTHSSLAGDDVRPARNVLTLPAPVKEYLYRCIEVHYGAALQKSPNPGLAHELQATLAFLRQVLTVSPTKSLDDLRADLSCEQRKLALADLRQGVKAIKVRALIRVSPEQREAIIAEMRKEIDVLAGFLIKGKREAKEIGHVPMPKNGDDLFAGDLITKDDPGLSAEEIEEQKKILRSVLYGRSRWNDAHSTVLYYEDKVLGTNGYEEELRNRPTEQDIKDIIDPILKRFFACTGEDFSHGSGDSLIIGRAVFRVSVVMEDRRVGNQESAPKSSGQEVQS